MIISGFQQRVRQRLVEATRKGQLLARPEAEMEIWQEMEHTMLYP